jgi:2-hydroxyacyl-CoA lyase 1
MTKLTGAVVLARALKQQGVEYMFGIVGFPVIDIAAAAQAEGITYIGMRNEQSASYAAQAASYLTGRPQACVVVSGPGVIHALAGLANAQQNCWPMILIGGASPTYQNGMGAFQEERQVALAAPLCKYAHAVEHVERIPYYVEQAVRTSLYGRPGPAYLDMPDDIIQGKVEADQIVTTGTVGDAPRSQAMPEDVAAALAVLESAERPLVVIGKGMAWSRAEDEVREFIERTQLPFLASPMGKGILSDDDPLSIGAARSHALKEADVVFLMGARLNWIMHFGLPPRFAPGVRIIQLDIAAETIGTNVAAEVALVGDGKAVAAQLNAALDQRPWQYPKETDWRGDLRNQAAGNLEAVAKMSNDNSSPMNYYRAYRDIVEWLPSNAIIIGEGANTMDIGRTQMFNSGPRQRLDAGTYGTMGVGLGFMIAAAVVHPDRPIIGVQGDSAFGFSGMELETAVRYKLPIKLIVLNNGGIGEGVAALPPDGQYPGTMLTAGAHYEGIMEVFGGKGFYVTDPADLQAALDAAMAFPGPALINVLIHPKAGRKPQPFAWLTT